MLPSLLRTASREGAPKASTRRRQPTLIDVRSCGDAVEGDGVGLLRRQTLGGCLFSPWSSTGHRVLLARQAAPQQGGQSASYVAA